MGRMHPALHWILYQLQERALQPGALVVCLCLLSCSEQGPKGEATCQMSAAQLARRLGLTRRAVQLALAALRRRKLLRILPRRGGRHGPESNRYLIPHPPPGWLAAPGTLHGALRWIMDEYDGRWWSRGSLLVYLALLSFAKVIPPYPPCCQVSIRQLCDATGLSTRGVRYASAGLQRRGYITMRMCVRNNRIMGPQTTNLYFIEQVPPGWQSSIRGHPAAPTTVENPGLYALTIGAHYSREQSGLHSISDHIRDQLRERYRPDGGGR